MKRLIFIALSIILLAQYSCKKVQPNMKSLDCSCAKETSAEFEILEFEKMLQFNPVGTNTDTILLSKNVKFKALDSLSDYTWYIGNEILHTREVVRYFSQDWAGQNISITLVTRKNPNRICLPNDDGYDSITKTFFIQNFQNDFSDFNFSNKKTLMEGTYRMKSNFSQDSFDVVIDYVWNPNQSDPKINVFNFDGKGSKRTSDIISMTPRNYRQIWFEYRTVESNGMLGTFHYRLDGVAEFNFSMENESETDYVDHYLLGRKL